MPEDSQRLTTTTDSPVAIAAINRTIDQFLSYGKDAEIACLQGVAADPTCALLHAYAAAYYLSQECASTRKLALFHLATAQQQIDRVTEREQWYVAAIAAWTEGAIDRAIALHEAITDKYPQDLISVQQGQYHYFYLGDTERLLKIAEKVLPANRENHYLYGMVAFGLEQCDRLLEAEVMGQQAVAMNRCDPWAQHAVAHVLETQERIEEGIAWMVSHADTWETCNSMLYTHNWWHVALYYLQHRDVQKVLELYDMHIWGRACQDSPKDQVGAIATLLRLELQGVEVSDRWRDLSINILSRVQEHALPFQDLHYIYAVARIGHIPWVTEMLRSMQDHARTVNPYLRSLWTDIAIPAARGMVAHAKGNWAEAVAELKPVLPRLYKVGGSHTQRQLFKQLYQDAQLRTG